MMIINQLMPLIVAAIVNILLGMYYNINIEQCNFNYKKLLNGLIKAAIIILSFIGMAYCFAITDLSIIGVTPDLIINSSLIIYVTKAMQNLIKILGVNYLNNSLNQEIIDNITQDEKVSQGDN